MSTAHTEDAGLPVHGDPAERTGHAGLGRRNERDDPGQRGTLTIADRVVEKVAGYAVTLVDGAAAAPRRILGVAVGERDEDDRPNVKASVTGSTATVEAAIAVAWPASVRSVVADTRRRIREEVRRTTDVQVDYIDVDVVSMKLPERSDRQVR